MCSRKRGGNLGQKYQLSAKHQGNTERTIALTGSSISHVVVCLDSFSNDYQDSPSSLSGRWDTEQMRGFTTQMTDGLCLQHAVRISFKFNLLSPDGWEKSDMCLTVVLHCPLTFVTMDTCCRVAFVSRAVTFFPQSHLKLVNYRVLLLFRHIFHIFHM